MADGDFDYTLPPERIARYPAAQRDDARLLCLPRAGGAASHATIRDLPAQLAPGDVLVLNDSRVLPARLMARYTSATDGTAKETEILLIEAHDGAEQTQWTAMARRRGGLKPGVALDFGTGLRGTLDAWLEDGFARVTLAAPHGDIGAALRAAGEMPIPPYLKRAAEPLDRERYQTVYATQEGSVAAPTAGLHFTPALLAAIEARGVRLARVTLHVGPGTFLPMRDDGDSLRRVPPERFLLPPETAAAIERTRAAGGRVVAVGTTVTRTLETAARDDGTVAAGEGRTALVIAPGHRFRVVDALLTNFHLPRSTLLMLVAAFAGRERVLHAYAQALEAGYRFYSYGDAMFIA